MQVYIDIKIFKFGHRGKIFSEGIWEISHSLLFETSPLKIEENWGGKHPAVLGLSGRASD